MATRLMLTQSIRQSRVIYPNACLQGQMRQISKAAFTAKQPSLICNPQHYQWHAMSLAGSKLPWIAKKTFSMDSANRLQLEDMSEFQFPEIDELNQLPKEKSAGAVWAWVFKKIAEGVLLRVGSKLFDELVDSNEYPNINQLQAEMIESLKSSMIRYFEESRVKEALRVAQGHYNGTLSHVREYNIDRNQKWLLREAFSQSLNLLGDLETIKERGLQNYQLAAYLHFVILQERLTIKEDSDKNRMRQFIKIVRAHHDKTERDYHNALKSKFVLAPYHDGQIGVPTGWCYVYDKKTIFGPWATREETERKMIAHFEKDWQRLSNPVFAGYTKAFECWEKAAE